MKGFELIEIWQGWVHSGKKRDEQAKASEEQVINRTWGERQSTIDQTSQFCAKIMRMIVLTMRDGQNLFRHQTEPTSGVLMGTIVGTSANIAQKE